VSRACRRAEPRSMAALAEPVMDSERPSAAEMLERADGRRRRQRRSAQDVLTIECDAPVSTRAFVRMPLTSTPTKRRWWPGPGSGGSGGELAKETTPNVGRGASGANGADGTRTGNGAIGAIGVGSGADAGSGTGTCTGDAASGAGTGTCDEAIGTGTGGCSDTDAGTGMGDESREAAAPSADGHSTSVRRTEKRFWTGTGTDETEKEDDGDKDGTDREEKNVAPGLRVVLSVDVD